MICQSDCNRLENQRYGRDPSNHEDHAPTARWHAHYARGATLVESFFQSVSEPFQLLLVGDPLCCPFGDFPKFKVAGHEKGADIKSDFDLQIKLASNSVKVRHYEIFYDGVFTAKVKAQKKIRIAINAMSNGYHELRIVGVADTPTIGK